MKFIQKDVDKRLLILVVTLLVLFITTTVYYQITYGSILEKYSKNQNLVNELTANAVLGDLNQSSNVQENIIRYKEYLDRKYDELNTLNENLKKQIESLKGELALVESQIEYQKAKEIGPTSQFRLYQSKVEEANSLRKDIKELCAKFKSLNITESRCSTADIIQE